MLKRSSGFTIVELVVVIVVIGILAAVISASYRTLQGNARVTALQSDLQGAGKTVSVWMTEQGSNSTSKLLSLYAGRYSAWIVGEGADNALTDQLRWEDVPEVPTIDPSAGSTLEIIGRYAGTGVTPVNERLIAQGAFCIAGATPGSPYDYRPMSGIHSQYNRMLYFDSIIGEVKTMEELADLHAKGVLIACEGHVLRWIE